MRRSKEYHGKAIDLSQISQEEAIQACIHVANGGSFADISEKHGFDMHYFIEMVRRKVGPNVVDDAMNRRDAWLREVVLREVLRIGLSDLREIFNDDGSLKPISQWSRGAAAAVSSVEVEELFSGRGTDRQHVGFTKKIKFWDKSKALDKLGKQANLFTPKVEISADMTLAELVLKSQDGDESTEKSDSSNKAMA